MIKRISFLSALTLLFFALFMSSGFCRSWDDLDRGERKIYGSEREEKFPIKAFIIEKEEWENHYSLMVLGLFKNKDYPRYTSLRVLPFYYNLESKIDNRKMNLFPLLLSYYEKDGDEETLFAATPIYYSNTNKYGADRSLFFLFWWGNENYSYKSESYQFLFPLLYHDNSLTKRTGKSESFWFSPLFISWSTENPKTDTSTSHWWAPIIPLTYHNVDSYGGHRNFLWLLDYSWNTNNKVETMERFWLFPLFLWSRANGGYTSVIPPIYIKNKYPSGEFYEHLFPLYARWRDDYGNKKNEWNVNLLFASNDITDKKTGKEIESTFWAPIIPIFYKSNDNKDNYYHHLLPLYGKWRDADSKTESSGIVSLLYGKTEQKSLKDNSVDYSNFWFPILPLYYSSYSKNKGTHKNVLFIFDWEKSTKGDLKNFSVFPLVYHETRERGTRYYFPFYLRWGDTTEQEGYHLGLFHYHSWNERGEKTWSWLYYNSEYTPKATVENAGEMLAGGSMENRKESYTHFLPLYWNWKNTKSEGTIFFPLYLNYKDSDTSLHVNLTGYARKTYMGPLNPDISVGVQKKDNKWFLDSDVSWLYDMWSISSRVPIRNPFTKVEKKDITETIVKTDSKKSNISTKNEFTRENSEHFWGWKILFGWMAYEKADSHKHFRLLPLAWINLTDNSEDKFIAVLPFFLSYKSVELDEEYLAVIPAYGYQRKGKSYKRGILINLYWDEYDHEENYREQTVLWPIVNWYKSPVKNGYRVFPFIWHKSWMEDEVNNSRTISLLHYNRKTEDKSSGELLYSKQLNPLYYKKTVSNEKQKTFSLNIPLLPIFHYDSIEDKYSIQSRTISPLFYKRKSISSDKNETLALEFWAPIIPLMYYNDDKEFNHLNILGLYDKYRSKSHSHNMLFPFYYDSMNQKEEISLFKGADGKPILTETHEKTYMNPLFYSSKTTSNNGREELKSKTFWAPIIPLYYTHEDGEYKHWNILGLADHCENKNYERNFLLPFYYSTMDNGNKHLNIMGLFDRAWESDGKLKRSMMLPLWYWEKEFNSEMFLIFPLLSAGFDNDSEKTRIYAGTYWYESKHYERENFYYLYDHKKHMYGKHLRNEYSMLFGTVNYEVTKELKELRLFWGALANYKSYRKNSNYELNSLLYLAGIESYGKKFHHRILPIYYYTSNGENDWSLLVPPILSYFSEEPNGDFDLAVLGLVYYRNEDIRKGTDRRMWLLGSLYNEVKVPERDYHSVGSLWGILWKYETEGDTNFKKFTILKGLYKWVEKDGKEDHTLFWVF